MKNEVSLLLKRIDDGQSREVAVDQFGETFNIPELFLLSRLPLGLGEWRPLCPDSVALGKC